MAQTRDIICLSVLGGWQSAFRGTDITFGPVFQNTNDLWKWQAENLYVLL